MNIQLCAMTAEDFTAFIAANNLALLDPQTARLGGGFTFYCDGVHLFLKNSGVVSSID